MVVVVVVVVIMVVVTCVCACVCICVCMCVRMRVCMCACARMGHDGGGGKVMRVVVLCIGVCGMRVSLPLYATVVVSFTTDASEGGSSKNGTNAAFRRLMSFAATVKGSERKVSAIVTRLVAPEMVMTRPGFAGRLCRQAGLVASVALAPLLGRRDGLSGTDLAAPLLAASASACEPSSGCVNMEASKGRGLTLIGRTSAWYGCGSVGR